MSFGLVILIFAYAKQELQSTSWSDIMKRTELLVNCCHMINWKMFRIKYSMALKRLLSDSCLLTSSTYIQIFTIHQANKECLLGRYVRDFHRVFQHWYITSSSVANWIVFIFVGGVSGRGGGGVSEGSNQYYREHDDLFGCHVNNVKLGKKYCLIQLTLMIRNV